MDIDTLKDFLTQNNFPDFRFRQIIKNYYSARFKSFEDMSDLPKDLRQLLSQHFSLLSCQLEKINQSGHTSKALLKLVDGQMVETVMMDYDNWLTACISSQVGCPLNCAFCATGKMGFKRNLTVQELVDQIIFWNQILYPKYIGRVVFMGMGEPFLNWDNLISALKIINSKNGLNLGARKISISTAGIVDKIHEFTKLNNEINLAISLHSLEPLIREKIMPVTKTNPLDKLIAACHAYTKTTRRQIFFEYALMKDENDREKDLKLLIDFLKSNRLFYLNLIPLNPISGGMTPSSNSTLNHFVKELERQYLNFSVRRSFGQSINAACGQLASISQLSQK